MHLGSPACHLELLLRRVQHGGSKVGRRRVVTGGGGGSKPHCAAPAPELLLLPVATAEPWALGAQPL